jgi:hypothetical protein
LEKQKPQIDTTLCADKRVNRIFSIVSANEIKVSTIYQKIERNRIESMHGKNPKKISNVYRFTDNNILTSSTCTAYSTGDTDIIIYLYFKADELIKVKTVSFDMANNKTEYNYYFDNKQLINKEVEMSGIHGAKFYIDRAARLTKNLKKRPFKFPL